MTSKYSFAVLNILTCNLDDGSESEIDIFEEIDKKRQEDELVFTPSEDHHQSVSVLVVYLRLINVITISCRLYGKSWF